MATQISSIPESGGRLGDQQLSRYILCCLAYGRDRATLPHAAEGGNGRHEQRTLCSGHAIMRLAKERPTPLGVGTGRDSRDGLTTGPPTQMSLNCSAVVKNPSTRLAGSVTHVCASCGGFSQRIGDHVREEESLNVDQLDVWTCQVFTHLSMQWVESLVRWVASQCDCTFVVAIINPSHHYQ
jgi:hypothetical protein